MDVTIIPFLRFEDFMFRLFKAATLFYKVPEDKLQVACVFMDGSSSYALSMHKSPFTNIL